VQVKVGSAVEYKKVVEALGGRLRAMLKNLAQHASR